MIQFLKINELISDHKSAYINFDKYYRNIIAELVLPEKERTHSGTDFIHLCKKELDKIIEQSPTIPLYIISNLKNIIKNDIISYNSNKSILNTPSIDKSIIDAKNIESKNIESKNIESNRNITTIIEKNIDENINDIGICIIDKIANKDNNILNIDNKFNNIDSKYSNIDNIYDKYDDIV